jgi:arylsulfatase A-like enzyme
MIAELDDHVGRILSALENEKLLEKTVILFTSDNGTTREGRGEPSFHIGGVDAAFFDSTAGLRGYKGSVYEGGLRVPFLLRLPFQQGAGRVIETPAWFPDLFPTVCEITGVTVPPNLDGVSLWPLVTERASLASRPTPMLWVYPEYGGQMAIRLGDMKAVQRNLKNKPSHPSAWEVYDLAADPGEQTNLASKRQDVIEQAVEVLSRETDENHVFPMPPPSSAG